MILVISFNKVSLSLNGVINFWLHTSEVTGVRLVCKQITNARGARLLPDLTRPLDMNLPSNKTLNILLFLNECPGLFFVDMSDRVVTYCISVVGKLEWQQTS